MQFLSCFPGGYCPKKPCFRSCCVFLETLLMITLVWISLKPVRPVKILMILCFRRFALWDFVLFSAKNYVSSSHYFLRVASFVAAILFFENLFLSWHYLRPKFCLFPVLFLSTRGLIWLNCRMTSLLNYNIILSYSSDSLRIRVSGERLYVYFNLARHSWIKKIYVYFTTCSLACVLRTIPYV